MYREGLHKVQPCEALFLLIVLKIGELMLKAPFVFLMSTRPPFVKIAEYVKLPYGIRKKEEET